MEATSARYESLIQQHPLQEDSLKKQLNTELLANSYAGVLGKSIEPAITPLGYDWKIGIALITSFAAKRGFCWNNGYLV